MSKAARSADQQMADEVAVRALNPMASRQKISESQSTPEFEENHKRLRAERLARSEEMTELAPSPELPDETPTRRLNFPTRIKNALFAAGLKTVGEVREMSDDDLLRLHDFGKGSIIQLRKMLGLPSTDGVRLNGPKG